MDGHFTLFSLKIKLKFLGLCAHGVPCTSIAKWRKVLISRNLLPWCYPSKVAINTVVVIETRCLRQ
jgi:hypothetical protein